MKLQCGYCGQKVQINNGKMKGHSHASKRCPGSGLSAKRPTVTDPGGPLAVPSMSFQRRDSKV